MFIYFTFWQDVTVIISLAINTISHRDLHKVALFFVSIVTWNVELGESVSMRLISNILVVKIKIYTYTLFS